MYLKNILFSFKTTIVLLSILAIAAGVATFIENDFGTSSALFLVYNSVWYETILVLTTINLVAIIYKTKMWNKMPRFLFHFSFVIILIGAITTRYVGYEGIMQIPEGITTNEMISLEPYLQVKVEKDGEVLASNIYQENFTSLFKNFNNFSHKIEFDNNTLVVSYVDFNFVKEQQASMGLLTLNVDLNGNSQQTRIAGLRGQLGVPKEILIDDYKITLEYGSKFIELPFAIRLNEFQLDRYPGSMAPSSYASEITVIKDDKTYDYRIFMNRTLSEGNYLFFQSSYFPDESGTVLSVNNDPGKWPTYLGYFLLTLGLFLNFFDKNSRFMKLVKFVSNKNIASFILATLFLLNTNLYANEQNEATQSVDKVQEAVLYLNTYKDNSLKTADNFGHLVVQTAGGRMQPLATLNRQIVQKLSGRSTFLGMNSDQ
ncbi:MAG TPA: cytochrome C biogenesis protein, partial [Arcobacter skirrowii]|nr:cytochrome C biogenesis protein [Aliarcobacter skirrowii]